MMQIWIVSSSKCLNVKREKGLQWMTPRFVLTCLRKAEYKPRIQMLWRNQQTTQTPWSDSTTSDACSFGLFMCKANETTMIHNHQTTKIYFYQTTCKWWAHPTHSQVFRQSGEKKKKHTIQDRFVGPWSYWLYNSDKITINQNNVQGYIKARCKDLNGLTLSLWVESTIWASCRLYSLSAAKWAHEVQA